MKTKKPATHTGTITSSQSREGRAHHGDKLGRKRLMATDKR